MKRKQLAEIFKALPWYDQLHILIIAKLNNFCKLKPIDMLLPAAIAQSMAMIVFLPNNLAALATSTLAIAIISTMPGLAKPLLSMDRTK